MAKFSKNKTSGAYRLGIGDTVTFSIVRKKLSSNNLETEWPKKGSSKYERIDDFNFNSCKVRKSDPQVASSGSDNQLVITTQLANDGSIQSTAQYRIRWQCSTIEVGRLEANGKTLNELRSEVRNILIRNSVSPRFQLEISNFKSQKAFNVTQHQK